MARRSLCSSTLLRLAHSGAIAVLAVVAGIACTPPPDGIDAGADDAAPLRGTLGLGEGERVYREIEDGDVLLIAQGCQGSQHVWLTLQASAEMDPRGMVVQLSLARARDEMLVSAQFRLRLSFTPDVGGSFSQLTGLTLQIEDPSIAIGEDLILHGRIEDRDGTEALTDRHVRVMWGDEVCSSLDGDAGADAGADADADAGVDADAGAAADAG